MSPKNIRTRNVSTDGATGTTITRTGAQYRQQSSSRRKKHRFLYDIISSKKKPRTRGSTKKRIQQRQNTIRQFLAPAAILDSHKEKEEGADVDKLHHNTTTTNEDNQRKYMPTDNVDCRGGDKIDANLDHAFCILTNNVTGVYNNIKKILNKVWKRNKLSTSNSKERTTLEFQPGSTATLVTDRWTSHWCYFRKKGHQNPDPRKLFFCDFTRFINSRLEKDEELIIGINANETDEVTSNIHKFLTDTDLVNAFRHAHPNVTPPNTFQRSDNCLDYIFITPAIIPAFKID
eukprot:10640863-Ditylum_brightwellii.AAC.1